MTDIKRAVEAAAHIKRDRYIGSQFAVNARICAGALLALAEENARLRALLGGFDPDRIGYGNSVDPRLLNDAQLRLRAFIVTDGASNG